MVGVGHECLEFLNHLCRVVLCGGVDREHSRSITHPKHLLACKLPVDITCESGKEFDILYMLFAVEDGLVEMGNAPPQRDVVVEQF